MHDETQDPATDESQEPQTQDQPDDEAGPAVKPLDPAATDGSGESGQVGQQDEQQPVGVNQGGFDPDQPVRTSAAPPEAQSGVPELEGGGNEGVEPQPQYAGPVDPPPAQPDADDADGDGEQPS